MPSHANQTITYKLKCVQISPHTMGLSSRARIMCAVYVSLISSPRYDCQLFFKHFDETRTESCTTQNVSWNEGSFVKVLDTRSWVLAKIVCTCFLHICPGTGVGGKRPSKTTREVLTRQCSRQQETEAEEGQKGERRKNLMFAGNMGKHSPLFIPFKQSSQIRNRL